MFGQLVVISLCMENTAWIVCVRGETSKNHNLKIKIPSETREGPEYKEGASLILKLIVCCIYYLFQSNMQNTIFSGATEGNMFQKSVPWVN